MTVRAPAMRQHPAGTVAGPRETAAEPLRIGASVRYSKGDAFEICGALALAESVLRSAGHRADAALLAAVFEVAEAGLSRSADGAGGRSVRPAHSLAGSNSMARELTQ